MWFLMSDRYLFNLQFSEQSQVPSPEDLQEILPLLSPKQLADAIWGFAKQGLQPSDDLMCMIAEEVRSKLEHFKCADEVFMSAIVLCFCSV